MTETPATFPDPVMLTIPYLGIDHPKTVAEITYLEKNIDEEIRQNMMKKDIYESDMHKIYNIIVGQTNEQLQEKAELGATL